MPKNYKKKVNHNFIKLHHFICEWLNVIIHLLFWLLVFWLLGGGLELWALEFAFFLWLFKIWFAVWIVDFAAFDGLFVVWLLGLFPGLAFPVVWLGGWKLVLFDLVILMIWLAVWIFELLFGLPNVELFLEVWMFALLLFSGAEDFLLFITRSALIKRSLILELLIKFSGILQKIK